MQGGTINVSFVSKEKCQKLKMMQKKKYIRAIKEKIANKD